MGKIEHVHMGTEGFTLNGWSKANHEKVGGRGKEIREESEGTGYLSLECHGLFECLARL